ncbi:protease FtsH subunit HflK [Sulfurivirga caldicuralii]|uniref:Protein HflK n=1 Tax=Sulfurivirga caldicuralii TaxID=364032 RepID=A0A1N6F1B5_9GAMM|nr:FtsH protease activity modulator HflK [Sulfurivirga caldicuralii]SIN89054.1 protease FtsH subunit HflK [Sulfurivirga caldicuralii]
MAWNEPGKPSQDPWGSGDKPPKGSGQGPDVDELVEKLKQSLGNKNPFGSVGMGVVALVIIVVWLLSGIYIVDPAERGAVQRFGAYVGETGPGPHWHIPWPVEKVTIINVDRIRHAEIGYRSSAGQNAVVVPSEALMLTEDENIVDIKIAIQYKISSARHYLFNVADPDVTLRLAVESALRSVVGKNKMDFVLTQGRDEVVSKVKRLAQEILDNYESGLLITSVNLQDAQPPEQVQAAFADVVKAREDRERLINEAQAYANDIIPKARGLAARELAEAEAYRQRVVEQALGETSRFVNILTAYRKAPEVTRERMYKDAVTNVLTKTSKVFMTDSEGKLVYLPLDRLQQGAAGAPEPVVQAPKVLAPARNTSSTLNQRGTTSSGEKGSRLRELLRSRELR